MYDDELNLLITALGDGEPRPDARDRDEGHTATITGKVGTCDSVISSLKGI